METIVINIRNKKDSQFIKDLLSRLDVEIKEDKESLRKSLGKSKIRSIDDLKSMGGIMKGKLISKEHLRNLSWKKRA
jgi:hypothetical protein